MIHSGGSAAHDVGLLPEDAQESVFASQDKAAAHLAGMPTSALGGRAGIPPATRWSPRGATAPAAPQPARRARQPPAPPLQRAVRPLRTDGRVAALVARLADILYAGTILLIYAILAPVTVHAPQAVRPLNCARAYPGSAHLVLCLVPGSWCCVLLPVQTRSSERSDREEGACREAERGLPEV